eukprot:scaffold22788_cov58-Phaeocystis_antarctica.AAC.3
MHMYMYLLPTYLLASRRCRSSSRPSRLAASSRRSPRGCAAPRRGGGKAWRDALLSIPPPPPPNEGELSHRTIRPRMTRVARNALSSATARRRDTFARPCR